MIIKSVKKAKVEVTVNKVHATVFNFREMLEIERPGAIHFSGHGVTRDEIRETNVKFKPATLMSNVAIEEIYQKGDALVFENQLCQGQYMYASDLQRIVSESNVQLDFVFMATCHSEFAARIFLNAGAHHVIGINKDEKIQDAAVITFTETFYAKLWKQGSRICMCFYTARLAVEINHGKTQADLFLLFKQEPQHTENTPKCYIYGNFQLGVPIINSHKSLLKECAPHVESMIGYQDLRQDLIEKLFKQKNRCIRVSGNPGTGKSTFARMTVNYLHERSFFEGGIIYVNCRFIESLINLKEKIYGRIEHDKSSWL